MIGEAIASTSGEIGQILEASEMLPHFSSQSKAAVRRSNSPDRFYKNLTFTRQNVKTDTEKIYIIVDGLKDYPARTRRQLANQPHTRES